MPLHFVLRKKPSVSGKSRVLVRVAKSVSKKATERNLLKRRIKAISHPIAKRQKRDFFVIVKPGADKLSFEDTKKQILNLVEGGAAKV